MPRKDTTGPAGKGPKKVNKGVPSRDGRGIGRGRKRGTGRNKGAQNESMGN